MMPAAPHSWRGVLCGGLMAWLGSPLLAATFILTSPDGRLQGEVSADAAGAWRYAVRIDGREIVAPSRLGVTVDGTDLGAGAQPGVPEEGILDESYALLGGKSRARNHARTLRLPLRHPAAPQGMTLEARAYDDGFAWRLIVPGEGQRRVQRETSEWTLPAGCRVWYFERNSDWKLKSYAGEWLATGLEQLGQVSARGPVQGPPLVAELPAEAGYVLVTEAALENYSGLRLRAETGTTRLRADFTEGEAGFVVEGPITTPWRATLVARDLDALATSDLVTNLAPPPSPVLYADTSYIRPGRAVWRWWSSGTGSAEQERRMIDDAAELGFEYTLVDEGWEAWPATWTEVRRLVEHGRARGVGVLLWKAYAPVADPADGWARLRAFLDEAARAGVAGVKLDFLNAESKDRVDFSLAALRLAAERRLLVIFHGVAKPTGEARTYPNEITREGIRGLELNRMKEGPIPAAHNAALPFTRFVVGPGDYTPVGYSNPGPTTWAHQLATLVQFHSPLQVVAEHPDKLLRDPATRPALDVLRLIPAVWDETRVLRPSRIGELSLLARRSGTTWFLAALNGPTPRQVDNLALSFLGAGRYHATELTSPARTDFVRREKSGVRAGDTWSLPLTAGDGAVVMFTPEPDTAGKIIRGGAAGFPSGTIQAEGLQAVVQDGRLILRAETPTLHRGIKLRLAQGEMDLSRFRYVEAEVANFGTKPVLFTFWAMTGEGWGGVSTFPDGDPSGRETLAPGERKRLRLDLHARYSGAQVYTPAVDASAIRWLELVFERGQEPLHVELGEITVRGEGPALPAAAMASRFRVETATVGEPAPGRRVFRTAPGWTGTEVRHVLTLPRGWQPGRRYPVLVEFTGNRFYHKFCYSTGRTEDGHLAAGLARGEDFICLNLPFVSEDGQSEQINGWGDPARAVDYCLAALDEVFARFGGDRRAVFFTGFSRGDYAANYIALRDDRIAAVWRGFLTSRHPARPWTDQGEGWHKVGVGWNERAARFGPAAWFYAEPELGADVHADGEFLEDRPSTVATRRWLAKQVAAIPAGGKARSHQ